MPIRRNKVTGRQRTLQQFPRSKADKSTLNYQRGYDAGYARGVLSGQQSLGSYFDGTSIIIPTFNQRELLLQCIGSIEAYTTLPYEIIVVDNGSSDGTIEELQARRGVIRIAVHPQNLGFARAINTGLMMAKGRTIVLLNNDILVTEGWLSNMLHCLDANANVAVVGPVTNYISGNQQIDVPYDGVNGMQEFAATHNISDPLKWRDTDRLVGFCLLFNRETFEEVGYFDEGYEFGNFEDDDWMIRLRLQGKKMKIAGDTFIHHFGSMTMKGLGQEEFAKVNNQNETFFTGKWGNVYELLPKLPEQVLTDGTKSVEFFPTHIWIRGLSNRMYWLEHGVKYPVNEESLEGNEEHNAVRLSIIDLLQIPTGPQRTTVEEVLQINDSYEGKVFECADGCMYQVDQGKRREMISSYTIQSWGLSLGEQKEWLSEVAKLPIGLPILPALRLKSEDI
jgi:GT2 family glycosyltransferase